MKYSASEHEQARKIYCEAVNMNNKSISLGQQIRLLMERDKVKYNMDKLFDIYREWYSEVYLPTL